MSSAGGRLRTLAALVLAGAVAGAAWGLADEPRYAAEASVVTADEPGEGTIDLSDPDSAARLVAIAGGRAVSEEAARLLGGDVSGADLLAETGFSVADGVLIVRSTADSADLAAAAANAYAEAVIETTTRQQRRRLESASERLTEELATLDPASPEGIEISERLAGIDERAALGPPLQSGAEAALPESPDEDRSAALWAGAGALAGLLLGGLALVLSARRSPFGRSRRRAGTDIEILAELPRLDPLLSVPATATLALDPAAAEPLEQLSDELDLGGSAGPRSLAVLSASAGQGRSSLALGIAAATAGRGGRVLLIEADLYHPSLARRLGLDPGPGLTDYLAGAASPRSVLQTVRLAGVHSGTVEPVLVCVPAGGAVHDGDPLGGSRFAELVERVGRVYDLIVFDTSPLLGGPEGLEVARTVETNLLCARAGSRPRELARAAERAAGTDMLGAVLLGSEPA